MDEWQYRVIKSKEGTFSVQEVYFNEDGQPYAHTVDLTVEGDTLGDLGPQLQDMINSLKLPTIDEIDAIVEDGRLDIGLGMEEEKPTYIYESPDGGETIYWRKSGSSIREKKDNTEEDIETWKRDVLKRGGI